ncbi:shikimate kinase [Geobacter sp. AOG2]|uniref:shikimate kinase n=1 Tax=Geobacter sp. AOG2 TaxID=1566347 RepID=UPI001CC4833F|nr:shikimate kinase [Geobacter sp. AOG2]GFE60857.1 shikimate kinase [Geobacter sp. AOG2]
MLERPLILTGFMGAGKSSIGRLLAGKLKCPFIDLDAEIVAVAGRSINAIFAEEGEAVFRVLESSCLEHALHRGGAVIATGGGAVIADANRALMRASGVVVNLTAPFDRIMERLSGATDRPLYAGDDPATRAKTLLEQREQFYNDADIRIDTDGKSVEDVAAEILGYLRGLEA